MFLLSQGVPQQWTAEDRKYMEEALRLARLGLGTASPNPMVGAVVVNEGRIVGTGYHERPGRPHAEAVALEAAGEKARGATLYVTLEPCSHYGRTPPCADLIIQRGVRRVVAAMEDPNPLVAGRGFARLRDAGVDVSVGLLQDAAAELNEAFITYITKRRPFIHLKTAMSLDGKIACHTGASQWITGPLARQEVHRLRSVHDGIMVGIGTVLADDPRLTVRLDPENPPEGPYTHLHPIRIVVDSKGRLPLSARVLEGAGEQTEVIVATTAAAPASFVQALRGRGVRVWQGDAANGRVDLQALLEDLAEFGIGSILVEAGPTLAGALFDLDLVDRVTTFIAPLIIGGEKAPTSVGGVGAAHPDQGRRLVRVQTRQFGPDLMITGSVQREGAQCSPALSKK